MNTVNLDEAQKNRLADLVRAAQAGDREAFGELFERFQGHVLAIALRRLGDYGEAQELCQDVFIQAMEKIGQLRRVECFAGWLRSITHRMAVNRIVRRRADLPTEPGTLETNCVDHDTPLEAIMEGERRTHLRKGLKRLRTMDRKTLEAFYVKGRSLLEMSAEFDAPLGTIKRRLHVARKRLAKEVEPLVAV